MRACSGVWVAHGSGTADRETVDAQGPRRRCRRARSSYLLRRVWLTEEEENGYYYGFSNEGLWPLCHVAHARPVFRAEDWEHYVTVNRKFADAVCQEVDSRRPDRPRAGLPLRARAADDPRDAAAGHDHHVLAHPVAERRAHRHLPVARGADLAGCSARASSASTPSCTATTSSTRSTRSWRAASTARRTRSSRAAAGRWSGPIRSRSSGRCAGSSDAPPIAECRAERASRSSGLPPDALLGVGVDRLDYTKGIEERLLAVERAAASATRSSAAASPSCSWRRRAAPRSTATAS